MARGVAACLLLALGARPLQAVSLNAARPSDPGAAALSLARVTSAERPRRRAREEAERSELSELLEKSGKKARKERKEKKEGQSAAERCAAIGMAARPRGQPKPKVFDVMLYDGEGPLLDLRRQELTGAADHHVVGITERTFRGEPNDLSALKASFQADERTTVLVVPWKNMSAGCKKHGRSEHMKNGGALSPEEDAKRRHRSACWQSFARNWLALGPDSLGAGPNDWVIVSDVDEVPDRSMVQALKECEIKGQAEALVFPAFAHYIYSTRCKVTAGRMYWYEGARGPVAMHGSAMRKYGLQGPRFNGQNCYTEGPYGTCQDVVKQKLPPSAWHLSSCLMSAEEITKKMESNVDRVDEMPSLSQMRRQQSECSDARGFYTMERLPRPASAYPQVPHAMQESPEKYRL